MKRFLLLPGFFALTLGASAQCSMSSSGGTNVVVTTGFLFGQSFTATCTGYLDYVQYIANENGTMSGDTLKIYSGSTVSTTPIYVQPFTAITAITGQPLRVTLTGTVPVTNGNQYTFEFFVNVDVLANFSDVYAGGIPFQDGQPVQTADLDFTANVVPTTGINDPDFASHFRIFPNPANGYFQVNSASAYPDARIELVGYDGRIISNKDLEGETTLISLAELPAGIYLARIISGTRSASFRIINQ